ncbi:hypothetical protein LTR22_026742 [Elasticomyces elasticus]|nr:hypothetical protein LTR22_026742 [Elasticomyces elasticus]KAK4910367.1 hypothetical protein LTR49_020974 [Elasticomyces elasticus]KAK5740855.1 hypothetical protein LTS12_024804 [Elasticomyces elasticus]
MSEQLFHCFPQLPLELREEIWRCCLPYRIRELDSPRPEIIFLEPDPLVMSWGGPTPCNLKHTTHVNGLPPMISRVCYESRKVAHEAGSLPPPKDKFRAASELIWDAESIRCTDWRDPTRESVHLNYNGDDSWFEQESSGVSLQYLAHNRLDTASGTFSENGHMLGERVPSEGPADSRISPWPPARRNEPFLCGGSGGSFRAQYMRWWFDFDDDDLYTESKSLAPGETETPLGLKHSRDRDILRLFPSWLVVMRTIIIHSDYNSAAATGLFGLLGDAPVQVIDVAEDEAKVTAYFALAAACEKKATAIKTAQNFQQESASSMSNRQRNLVMATYRCERLAVTMRPAIMFRLCTQQCNHLPTQSKR